eukprot:SAG22_NODE_796_length_7149_cov_3.106525_7_plen_296_part_00
MKVDAVRRKIPLYRLALAADPAFVRALPGEPTAAGLAGFEAAGDYKTRREAAERARRAEWLVRTLGISADRLDKVQPRMKGCWEAHYLPWRALLERLGFGPDQAAAMLVGRPGLLDSRVETAEAVAAYLQSDDGLRLTTAELMSAVQRSPSLLNIRYTTLLHTVEWLLGPDSRGVVARANKKAAAAAAAAAPTTRQQQVREMVLRNPGQFHASLDGRVRPRHAFWLEVLQASGGLAAVDPAELMPLHALALLSDKDFATRLGVELPSLQKFVREYDTARPTDSFSESSRRGYLDI